MRVVFDTNVFISALLVATSTPARVLRHVEAQGVVLYSESTLLELARVLAKPKIAAYVDEAEAMGLIARLQRNAERVTILQQVQACRDAQDNHILDVAINGRATAIITGDNDLLVMHPYRDVAIRTPAQFHLDYGF